MSGTIYEVRWRSGKGVLLSVGSYRTRAEAEARVIEMEERARSAKKGPVGYWIEEVSTEGLFEFPSRPTPRERFSTRVETASDPGKWTTCHVEILEGDRVVYAYERNYAMLQTFEPFRQAGRDYALISPDYTATAVVDLEAGEIVASEEHSGSGFCPVGFYVPDWWDVNSGTTLPGSMHWSTDKEWPNEGTFGFVWGCVWGDDSSWKVQYLDLSDISGGVIRRDDRFGYVKLAAHPKLEAREFIRCWSWDGNTHVEFATETAFDLGTGAPYDENA